MKKQGKFFRFFSIVVSLVLTLFAGCIIASTIGISPVYGVIALSLLGFVPMPKKALRAGVQVEIWQRFIMENLFKNNQVLNYAYNADQFVLQGKVVHIAQAGAKPATAKNRTQLPATVTLRKDSDITYALDEYTTDPILIPDADLVELSYDKMANVLSDHMSTLREIIADWLLYYWSAESATNIIRTTGADAAATAPGATGTRKIFTKDNLRNVRYLMNKMNIPKEDRYALLPSSMMDQLQSDVDLLKRDYAQELDLTNGIITRLFGFNIMERSDTTIYSTALARKAPGDALAATDHEAALCWQKNSIERAMGDVKFFEKLNDPTYFGDIYSALVRMGGRKRRENGAGVIQIVQA